MVRGLLSPIDEIRELEASVDGFLGKREGPFLYLLAQIGAKVGSIVEIGSYQGKSALWLGKGAQAVSSGTVYAVDPKHANADNRFRANMSRAGLASTVQPVPMLSSEALKTWNEPIGFLWIDGDHSYEGVALDFYGWSPYVTVNGIVALHDTYSFEGVRKLVDEEILKHDQFRVLGQVDGILALQKTASKSSADKAMGCLTLGLRRIYNYARATRKPWRALPRKLMRGIAKAWMSV